MLTAAELIRKVRIESRLGARIKTVKGQSEMASMAQVHWSLICGDYLNAWSLADLLREVGAAGRVVCIKKQGDGPALMELYGRSVEVWEFAAQRPDDWFQWLSQRIPRDDTKTLFFTDERFLETLVDHADHPWLSNARFFPGPDCPIGHIVDKFEFYRFLERHGLNCVPQTIPGNADPLAVLGETFFLRFKRSWVGMQSMPRIELIQGRAQLVSTLERCRNRHFTEADWCYQERLSVNPEDNVSVCGWHAPGEAFYLTCRKVLQYPTVNGYGDVCEVIPDKVELLQTTQQILSVLRYRGPFELEFVRDLRTGRYMVIELNPRFWMQHALTATAGGWPLVSRYLGLPPSGAPAGIGPRYYVNTIIALYRLVRLDFRGWRYLRHPHSVCVPPISVAFRWLPRVAVGSLLGRWRGWRAKPSCCRVAIPIS